MKSNLRFAAAAVCLAAGALMTSSVQADCIWFAQRARQLAFIYGFGADDMDAVKRQPLIKEVVSYDANWKPVATTLRVSGPLLLVDTETKPTVVTGVLDNNYWTKNAAGKWQRKGKDEVPDAVDSMKAMKYAVSIQGPLTSQMPALPDQVLQVTPVGAAIPRTAGDPITLRVLFNGKPVAGAEVLRDWVNDPNGKAVVSGADGTVTIPVRNQGLNVIAATYIGPTDDPKKVDRIQHRATLSFVLPQTNE